MLVTIDMWTFLKTWYDADYKIKVTTHYLGDSKPFDMQSH